ncbi:hypothetical protein SDC9_46855 [bioreactor metagenome]|uniref:Uncharacterized protein n=1 Tax=bioreactor metagenome TaxID=1076179 RepID=A0A644WAU0_9ZZZZ
MKKLLSLLAAFAYIALASAGIAQAADINFFYPFGAGTIAYVSSTSVAGALSMGVQKEIWINDLVEHIYMTNEWLNKALNHDMFVLDGKVIHVPYAGDKPTVEKGRTSYPMTVLRRDDTDSTYVLSEFSSSPIAIPDAETVELSYDKRASVLMNTKAAMSEVVGHEFLYQWSPTLLAQMQRTTGSNVTAHSTGATGNRKKLTVADVKAAKKKMNKAGIPAIGRFMILDADMYEQLCDDLIVTQYRDASLVYDQKNGTLSRIEGFDVYQRAYVMTYTNDTTPVRKYYDAVASTDDNAAGLCWYQGGVARAMGTHKFFENIGDATYQADIYSALIRAGGKKWMHDELGVVALVQAAG